jgi:hypothetical protein
MVAAESTTNSLRLSPRKNEYSVAEAARILDVTSDELQSLLSLCVLDEMESIPNISKMRFRPADLVMLNLVKRTTGGTSRKA